jgi:hypothetical protein
MKKSYVKDKEAKIGRKGMKIASGKVSKAPVTAKPVKKK